MAVQAAQRGEHDGASTVVNLARGQAKPREDGLAQRLSAIGTAGFSSLKTAFGFSWQPKFAAMTQPSIFGRPGRELRSDPGLECHFAALPGGPTLRNVLSYPSATPSAVG